MNRIVFLRKHFKKPFFIFCWAALSLYGINLAWSTSDEDEIGTIGGTGAKPQNIPDVIFNRPDLPERIEIPETPQSLDILTSPVPSSIPEMPEVMRERDGMSTPEAH